NDTICDAILGTQPGNVTPGGKLWSFFVGDVFRLICFWRLLSHLLETFLQGGLFEKERKYHFPADFKVHINKNIANLAGC
ncbi:MAG: hypothetical protein ACOCV9_08420, partial [Marinilabiliaceae bacterium]